MPGAGGRLLPTMQDVTHPSLDQTERPLLYRCVRAAGPSEPDVGPVK